MKKETYSVWHVEVISVSCTYIVHNWICLKFFHLFHNKNSKRALSTGKAQLVAWQKLKGKISAIKASLSKYEETITDTQDEQVKGVMAVVKTSGQPKKMQKGQQWAAGDTTSCRDESMTPGTCRLRVWDAVSSTRCMDKMWRWQERGHKDQCGEATKICWFMSGTVFHWQFKAVADHNGWTAHESIYLPLCRGKPSVPTRATYKNIIWVLKDNYRDHQLPAAYHSQLKARNQLKDTLYRNLQQLPSS
jgi:hypothetical protein